MLVKIWPLRTGHVIRRMCCVCKRIIDGILSEMSELNSRTDSLVIFKLGGRLEHMTADHAH